MSNRLIVLAAGLVFAASVAAVAVIAPGDGPDLEKLPVAAGSSGTAESRSAAPAGDSAASSLIGPVDVEYRVKGTLAEPAGPAPAYRLGASATRAQVLELAAVLGVDGPVQEMAERYVVRGGDRELNVEKFPGLPWNLGLACGDTVGPDSPVSSDGTVSKCVTASIARPEDVVVDGGGSSGSSGSAGSSGSVGSINSGPCLPDAECLPLPSRICPTDTKCEEPNPVPLPEPVRPADLPTRADAEARARAVFTKLGAGLDRFEISDGFDAWYTSVQPRIGGLPTTDRYTSVAVGPKGRITYANGVLAVPERIGDYPLAGTAVGLERLRTGAGGGWFAYGAADQPLALGAPEIADCSAPTVICDPPTPSRSFPVGETQVVTLTGVRLALETFGDRLVPVYVFEIEGGGETYGVPAVVDALLEKPGQ